jgi:TPR repeat protein
MRKLEVSGEIKGPLCDLPIALKELRLNIWNGFDHPLLLPEQLEVLDIWATRDFNRSLGNLPANMVHISLGHWFNQALGPLPCNLIKLKLGDSFDQPLGQIPRTLQTLDIGHDFNHPLGLLPGTLKTLAIGNSFDHPLGLLPGTSETLAIGDSFDHPLGLLPGTLETLEIGDSFDQPLGQLPGTLTRLKIGDSFNQALDELPHSLKKLRLGEKFEHTVETLPRFIEVFEVGRQDMAGKYEKGMDGVEKDINKSIHLYEAKAKGGDLWAQVKTGFMYASIQKHSEAVAWFASAAGMDEEIIAEWRHGKSIVASAQGMLGRAYGLGEGVDKNEKEAVKWFKLAAEQGTSVEAAEAQLHLGNAYCLGEGVEKDDREAVKWYKLAAEQGEESAQLLLGIAYHNGKGVEKDDNEASKWYKLAGEKGNASAQFNLGCAYYFGQGVEKDDKEAVKWYKLAAEKGHMKAQYNVGIMCSKGEGVQKDAREAIKWYKLAADQGYAAAQHSLALMYAEGAGVPKDEKKAVELFEAAAAQGYADAKSQLLKKKSTQCTAVRPPPPKKRRRGGLRRSDELDIELTQLRGTIGAQRKEVQAIETRIQANEARAEALEAKIKEAKQIEEEEDKQERAKAAPKKMGRGGGASSSAASNPEPFVGYSPYAHKEDTNKVLMQKLSDTTRTYCRNFDAQEADAFCHDGPDAMTTKALNRFGITKVQIVNDDRHGDFDEIQRKIVNCEIQADAFKGTVCDFLSTTNARYNFILHDGHGWNDERAKEIDALLDHIAPVCLFAVSVQVKGCGVACSHGPVQSVMVKQEPTSDDDGGLRSTNVKEHTEIHRFSKIVTDKMAVKNITLRGPRLEYDAPGRDPRTVFRVLMWVLDAREMREHEHMVVSEETDAKE